MMMPIQRRQETKPAPIVVNPSQNWYGPDGTWSTFQIQVGTPPQSFDILPSTASSETWVPLAEGCTASDPTNCPSLRGVQAFNGLAPEGFLTNQSSSWSLTGLYAVATEQSLGIDVNGQYGSDVVGLNGGNGSSSTNGVSLGSQIVAGLAAKNFLLGEFGLGIQPTSFSSSAAQEQSFISTLRTFNLIPSLSYGYTAGASYRNKQVQANLVLGGYDQSRFTPSNRSFTFASSDSALLTVGVQSIVAQDTLAGTTSYTSTRGGHLSVIDSTIPHLWLPRAICDEMELSLGLSYDNQSDLYLVNDTMHKQLKSLNPTFTFKLGNTAIDDGNGTNIQLPYAAFDLQVGWPIYSSNQNYFPIRRAANNTQFRLGRALLQEAYIVVDYERQNFTVGQAVFTDPLPSERIITIQPKSDRSRGAGGIGAGAIAGIVVAAVVVLMGTIIVFFFLRRRRKQKEGTKGAELEANAVTRQSMYNDPKYEPLQQGDATVEMSAEGEHRLVEMPVEGRKDQPHNYAQELDSPRPVFEMMGDTPRDMDGTPRTTTTTTTPRGSAGPSPYNTLLGTQPHMSPGFRPSPEQSPQFPPERRR